MGLRDILSGRRFHFNNKVSSVFGEILNKLEDVVKDITKSDKEIILPLVNKTPILS